MPTTTRNPISASSHAPRTNGTAGAAVNVPMRTTMSTIGDIVCRGAIPLWIGAGALFKLMERNPNLLPRPVVNVVFGIHDMVGIGTTEQFLELAMRSIIAVEIIFVAGMIFLPRLSKWLALAMLALFITILGSLVWQGALSCGCFGASGPSPKVVLGVDSVLFALALIFTPTRARSLVLPFVLVALIGGAAAFAMPAKSGGTADAGPAAPGAPAQASSPSNGAAPNAGSAPPPPAPPSTASDPPTPPATPPSRNVPPAVPPTKDSPPAAANPPSKDAPSSTTPPAAGAATTWPPPPAKTKGFYAPRFNTWVGKKLSEQEMMLMLKRPLPAGLDQGRWHIVLYRVDCDHCQELINTHFSGKLATRTMLVKVPDATPGKALSNTATDVTRSELLRVGDVPDYVIGTPIVLTVVDGVVKAVCEDPAENPSSLAATLDAK